MNNKKIKNHLREHWDLTSPDHLAIIKANLTFSSPEKTRFNYFNYFIYVPITSLIMLLLIGLFTLGGSNQNVFTSIESSDGIGVDSIRIYNQIVLTEDEKNEIINLINSLEYSLYQPDVFEGEEMDKTQAINIIEIVVNKVKYTVVSDINTYFIYKTAISDQGILIKSNYSKVDNPTKLVELLISYHE